MNGKMILSPLKAFSFQKRSERGKTSVDFIGGISSKIGLSDNQEESRKVGTGTPEPCLFLHNPRP